MIKSRSSSSSSSTKLWRVCCLLWLFSQHEFTTAPVPAFGIRYCQALSSSPPPPPPSRRDAFKAAAPLAAAAAVGYGRAFTNVYQNVGLKHPEAHERRVEATLTAAILAAAAEANGDGDGDRPFSILEVGMGTDCRVIRRGLYGEGLRALSASSLRHDDRTIRIVGVDPRRPDDGTLADAQRILDTETSRDQRQQQVDLRFVQQCIDDEEPLPFADGSFDVVWCCLTLCSVADPVAAVRQMHRLVRPHGGTLGYVEHVAVDLDDEDESYRFAFLAQQQKWLDPLQRRVADNCHLRRHTEETIRRRFQTADDDAVRLQHERFLVDAMWPVSMQARGVYQRGTRSEA